MKRLLQSAALTLAVLTAVSLFAACGETKTQTDITTAVASTDGQGDVTAAASETLYVEDDLGTMDFQGQDIRILYWQDRENQEYFAEGQDGNSINDAIYTRNAKVSERMNVTLSYTGTDGDSGNAKNFLAYMQTNYQGGTDAFDVISAHSRSIGLCAYNGLTQDLKSLEYINLDKPWWPDSITDTCTINGKIYFVSGDISTNNLYMMYAIFLNRDMLDDLKLDDPYKDVEAGTWTIDRMIELSKGVYADTDNDGIHSTGDTFGFISQVLHADIFLYGSGIIGIENSSEGLALSDSFTGEKTTDLITKLNSYLYGNSDGFIDTQLYKAVFADGRALFTSERVDFAISDLGEKNFTTLNILPAPKYNTDQEDYITAVGNPFSLYAVPVNAEKADVSAAFLECMASESYRTVTPEIFELAMKSRYSSGSNDAKVYDIIREGTVYDLSRIFWKVLSDNGKAPDTLFQEQLSKGAGSWTSTRASATRSLKSTITKINKQFDK